MSKFNELYESIMEEGTDRNIDFKQEFIAYKQEQGRLFDLMGKRAVGKATEAELEEIETIKAGFHKHELWHKDLVRQEEVWEKIQELEDQKEQLCLNKRAAGDKIMKARKEHKDSDITDTSYLSDYRKEMGTLIDQVSEINIAIQKLERELWKIDDAVFVPGK